MLKSQAKDKIWISFQVKPNFKFFFKKELRDLNKVSTATTDLFKEIQSEDVLKYFKEAKFNGDEEYTLLELPKNVKTI